MSAARKAWVQRMLAGVERPIVRYGSPDWLALPEGDRRKVAGVVAAAESAAIDADNFEEDLRVELDAMRAAHKFSEDAEYVARRDAHREAWTGRGFRQDPVILAEVVAEWAEWAGGDAS